jgi:hypothetical protein
MRLLGISTKDKKKLREPTLVDFLQFVDAVVEVHGDPFYELRYRCAMTVAATCALRSTPATCSYLFRLIDLDNSDSLEDEEVVPLLKATGLDEQTARATARRLLGDQLTVRAPSALLAFCAWLIRCVCMRR